MIPFNQWLGNQFIIPPVPKPADPFASKGLLGSQPSAPSGSGILGQPPLPQRGDMGGEFSETDVGPNPEGAMGKDISDIPGLVGRAALFGPIGMLSNVLTNPQQPQGLVTNLMGAFSDDAINETLDNFGAMGTNADPNYSPDFDEFGNAAGDASGISEGGNASFDSTDDEQGGWGDDSNDDDGGWGGDGGDSDWHSGGPVTGKGDVKATLQGGEYVIRKDAVSQYGKGLLDAINKKAPKKKIRGLLD